MLRRDYFLRLIQDLFAAIANLYARGDDSEKQKDIEALYNTFGANCDFFRSACEDDIVACVVRMAAEASGCSNEMVDPVELSLRLDLLAALLYADADLSLLSPNLRSDVLLRSLWMYERAEALSDSYSIERQDRIRNLRRILNM